MMTIEASSAGRVVEKSNNNKNNRSVKVRMHVGKIIKEKNYKRSYCKRNVRVNLSQHHVRVVDNLQKLFDACKNVFKGPGTVPSPDDVRMLCDILDGMRPEDVGLSRDLHFFRPKNVYEGTTPRVTSATIYKCRNFELSIFFLPANSVIPLHNHPEMTVFSKLLLGTMHIKAYDWVNRDHSIASSPSKPRLAKLKANRNFTAPCDTSVLYPNSGGNLHEFRAVTPCAVLDVIGPPYSKEDGRDCSYYRDHIACDTLRDKEEFKKYIEEDGDDSYGWLEEIKAPNESEMDGIEYMGPKIIDFNS